MVLEKRPALAETSNGKWGWGRNKEEEKPIDFELENTITTVPKTVFIAPSHTVLIFSPCIKVAFA